MASLVKKRKAYPLLSARRFFPDRRNDTFRQRGEDITRIEALSDGVFAFSISLLIMSLEVPQTFKELKLILQTFLPFAATVCLVVLFWYQQYRFFRNYGLNDVRVIVLNVALLLTVLFYVYPLKFLFSLLFGMLLHINFFVKATAHGETVLTQQEFPQLVMIYSAGYMAIWTIFFFLYLHAWRLRHTLQLSAFEVEETKRQLRGAAINVLIGLICSLFAWAGFSGLAGLCFILLAPTLMINDWWFRRRLRKKLIV
jgi:uncharacterized membrane protein